MCLQYVNPELYQLKKFGGNNRRGGGRGNYSQQHGTFRKGAGGFGNKGGFGGRSNNYASKEGGGYNLRDESYTTHYTSSGSKFQDRSDGSKHTRFDSGSNGHSFANGNSRFQ